MKLRTLRYFFSTTAPTIRYTEDPSTNSATITLINPAKRNALSAHTLTQLSDQIQNIKNNQSIRSLFLRSEGPVFSSGHDLKQLNDSQKAQKAFSLAGEISQTFRKLPFPVVSVVNGIVAAAGLQIMASTDIVIASSKSTFSTPGVKWGIFCTTPGIALIRSFSSQKKAMQMLLLGEPISAEQAYKFGLVSKVVEEGELQATVKKYADGFNHLSRQVLALGKQGFYSQKQKADLKQAYKFGLNTMCENLSKDDGKQGLKAFGEKRHPQWKK